MQFSLPAGCLHLVEHIVVQLLMTKNYVSTNVHCIICLVHVHCEWKLYIYCMYSIRSIYYMYTLCLLHVHCVFTACTLCTYRLHVNCVSSPCKLCIYCTYTTYILHVLYAFTAYTLRISCMYNVTANSPCLLCNFCRNYNGQQQIHGKLFYPS